MMEEREQSIFDGIQTGVVVREAYTLFNEQQIRAERCAFVLTKILYLINQGERFSSEEATQVFFAVTKLFQSSDIHLRRLVYLVIKELRVESDSSLIVVSCLSKDMVCTTDPFRANSIRVLAKIMDAGMIGGIERFLKQAIVEKNTLIVSSTLVASQHIWTMASDVVKRFQREVQEALQSPSPTVQYHALTLLYQIKSHDRLAISKIVLSLVRSPPRGMMAICLLIRIIASDLASSAQPNADLLKFLTSCLAHKSHMVVYESARTMCALEALSAIQLAPAISVLQDLLSSPSPTQRFAAVKTLSHVVHRYPLIVTPCSVELERLITDSNRSIGTLAISTLLKTGAEANVDRLMKSISGFMSEISDEFRIVMIGAVKTLALKFPAKHHTLMNFLSTALREEGGFKYKKCIIDAIIDIIEANKEATESGLEHFCEFIEDCEFPELSSKIIHILCDRGPYTPTPARYIRFIFNRVILETASVRAAAVSALAKFAVHAPQLTESVIVLLKRCLNDNDDEVRDRAIFYLTLLESGSGRSMGKPLFNVSTVPSPADLELSLQVYLQTNDKKESFNLTKHLVKVKEEAPVEDKKPVGVVEAARLKQKSGDVSGPLVNPYIETLNSIPEIAALGPIFKSSQPVEVTESETEYVVTCIKHVLNEHIVFQFNVTNNMEDQQLENVTVEMVPEEEGLEEEFSIPEATIAYQQTGTTFVCMSRAEDAFASGTIANTLKFSYKEVDEGEVGDFEQEDEYELEPLEVSEADFMRPETSIGLVEFRRQWESVGNGCEVVKKYSLGLDSLQAAVDAVLELLGMGACEGSNVVADGARSHAVNLAGSFLDLPKPMTVLARAGVMMVEGKGVTLKIAVRSENATLNATLCEAIR